MLQIPVPDLDQELRHINAYDFPHSNSGLNTSRDASQYETEISQILAGNQSNKVEVPEERTSHCDIKHLHNVPKRVLETGHNITCDSLLHSRRGSTVFDQARKWMDKHKEVPPSDKSFLQLLQDCERFKRARGYHLQPVSQEEAEFPIAFNIIMHKDASQVEKLLRAIYRPQNVYCLHVDTKAEAATIATVRALAGCFPNVFVASKLESVVYAGISRLQADINCMKDLVKTPRPWRYLINLAGQVFPLKSNLELVKILRIYNGSNDIEGLYNRVLKGRFQNEWRETNLDSPHPVLKKTENKKNPPAPDNIDVVRGSAYGVFSRAFVEFVLTDEKARHLLEWSRTTYSPDEHYWATLHHRYSNPHILAPGSYAGASLLFFSVVCFLCVCLLFPGFNHPL